MCVKKISAAFIIFLMLWAFLFSGCQNQKDAVNPGTHTSKHETYIYEKEWATFTCPSDWVLENEIDYDDRGVHFAYFTSQNEKSLNVTYNYSPDASSSSFGEKEIQEQISRNVKSDVTMRRIEISAGTAICGSYVTDKLKGTDCYLYGKNSLSFFSIQADADSDYDIDTALHALLRTYSNADGKADASSMEENSSESGAPVPQDILEKFQGSWQFRDDGSLLVLNSDGMGGWYLNASDLNDNYYKGPYELTLGAMSQSGEMIYEYEDAKYYTLTMQTAECKRDGETLPTQDLPATTIAFYVVEDNFEEIGTLNLRTMSSSSIKKLNDVP